MHAVPADGSERVSKDQLKARLFGAAQAEDPHTVAVDALLEFIDDIDVTEAFRKLPTPPSWSEVAGDHSCPACEEP